MPVPFQSEYQVEVWGLEEGFPENSCSGIALSPEGYLWLGTFRGLVRFNGQDFKSWAPSAMPSLASNGIVSLHRDQRNRVWFSTLEGLVMQEQNQWWRWQEDDGWGDRTDAVRSFAEDGKGTLAMGRFSGRVLRFEDGRFRELPPVPGEGGALCAFDSAGTLYVVRRGFAGYLAGSAWQSLAAEAGVAERALGAGQDRSGHALIVCRNEVLRVEGGRVAARTPLSGEVKSFWKLTQDLSDNLWLAAVESGVYRIRPDGEVKHFTKADGLAASGGTRVVHAADDGSIWIGGGVGGLTRFRPIRFRYLGEAEGLGDRQVLTLAPLPDGRVMIGSDGSGLMIFDGSASVRPAEGTGGGASTRALLRTQDGTVWAGALNGGLMRVDDSRLVSVATEIFGKTETVSALFEDSRHRLWVGGDRHLAVGEKGTFHAVPLRDELQRRRPAFFAERRDGTVLLAKHHEVFALSAAGLEDQPLVALPEEWRISSLLVDGQDRLWIGTTAHGLAVFHHGTLVHLPPEVGLPAGAISALTQDGQGKLWFGLGRKMVRADPEELWQLSQDEGQRPALQVFDQDDGLRDLDFPYGTQPSVAKDAQGRIWFALVRGAAVIDPAALTLNERPPHVVIERISYVPAATQRAVEIALSPATPTPVLPAGSRLIRISYAALDFSAPRKQNFRVRLGGSAGEWQDMQRETAVSFLELPPGRHTLQVQACGSDGVWNRAGATLAFELAPFFWQTPWFRGLMGAAVIAVAAAAAWLTSSRRVRVARENAEREHRFAQAQARLALVLENTSDYVAFADASGHLVYINRAGRALVGLPPAGDIHATTTASLAPAWALDEFTRVALPAALRDGTWSGESALRHRDGREIPVSEVVLAHRAPDGTLDFTSTIARDISAAKRHSMVQDALRRLATSLTAALDSQSLGSTIAAASLKLFGHDAFFLVLLDAQGRVAAEAYMEDTDVGSSHPRPVPSDLQTLSSDLRPVLQGETLLVNRPERPEEVLKALPVGWGFSNRRSLSLMYAPILWEGRVVGIVSVQSYTLRRYAEPDLQQLKTVADHCGAAIARMNADALLRKNEARLRLAMRTANMGSWEIDAGTRLLVASPEAEDVYGYVRGTLSGPCENLVARVVEPGGRELLSLLERLLRGEISDLDHTHALRWADGTERWIEVKGHRQQRPDGSDPGRIIGVTADITSRRKAELEHARLEEQLRQSQKLEAIGTLAGGIAHDFNNILAAILGNADLALADLALDDPTREYVDKIKRSGQRARDLVRRILAFSRPQETRRQVTALRPVAEEVVKLLRATIPASVEIAITAAPDLPLIEVDATELHQVLLNLGTNAWHALGGRPGRIRFGLDAYVVAPDRRGPPDLAPGRYARITVNDNGEGIPAERIPRIFDPFFTTKAPGEGTGLGLSVVHGIMRANGGSITVSSTVGVGTTFELLFPASSASLPSAAPATSPPFGATVGSEHILFVDDEEALVLVAERVFTRAGYAVTACLRPKQALAIFTANPSAIDLVISDLSMPEMSGLDLSAELRRIDPTVPIILTSGYLRPGEPEAAFRIGVREVVEKPNTPKELLPIIARILKDKASRRPAPPGPSNGTNPRS